MKKILKHGVLVSLPPVGFYLYAIYAIAAPADPGAVFAFAIYSMFLGITGACKLWEKAAITPMLPGNKIRVLNR